MEQKQAKNDQQATNAALAALAAAGNTFALGQLWEVNKGFIRRQLWQWFEKNKPVADNAGLSFEDLVQEGYFAVDYAAKHYSAEQGGFTTYLSYALLKQIRTATCGEHTRGVTTEDGRRVAVSANPLNECSSLDVRLDESNEGSSTKGETIEDPVAAQAFQQTEDDIYTEELHTALETASTRRAQHTSAVSILLTSTKCFPAAYIFVTPRRHIILPSSAKWSVIHRQHKAPRSRQRTSEGFSYCLWVFFPCCGSIRALTAPPQLLRCAVGEVHNGDLCHSLFNHVQGSFLCAHKCARTGFYWVFCPAGLLANVSIRTGEKG